MALVRAVGPALRVCVVMRKTVRPAESSREPPGADLRHHGALAPGDPVSARRDQGKAYLSTTMTSSKGGRRIRVTIAFLLMASVPASAAPAARALSSEAVAPPPLQAAYVVDRFTTGEGLPSNSVVGIAEAPDGYLWLATLGGLARFDGRRFTIFHSGNSPGLASNRFRSVKSDPGGDLWAVGQTGEIFRRHD